MRHSSYFPKIKSSRWIRHNKTYGYMGFKNCQRQGKYWLFIVMEYVANEIATALCTLYFIVSFNANASQFYIIKVHLYSHP